MIGNVSSKTRIVICAVWGWRSGVVRRLIELVGVVAAILFLAVLRIGPAGLRVGRQGLARTALIAALFASAPAAAQELVLVREGDACDEANGACSEVSGVGYFQGEFQGLELAVKDTARYPEDPGGWVYFSFGHQPEPYAETAAAFPAESCNACHEASAATDFVFTQFYPVLRAAAPDN